MAGLRHGTYINRPACQRLLADAVTEPGFEPGGMDTPVSVDPLTGRPWRERFSPTQVVIEKRLLQAACYIVCTYLSGMRDSEVQELRRGCHAVARSADGVIERHKLRGRTFKGHGAQGREATWVVIEPVATAVEVLERMHPHDHLFTSPGIHAYPLAGHGGDLTGGARLGPGIVRLLNDFGDHLDQLQGAGTQPVVPLHEGRRWHFTSNQFRRTLAWHIANQPFGTVAGMLQYQHVSVATFEGYVGSSESGFRREVQAQRFLAALDDIVEDYKDHRAGMAATGPGATRRNALFADVAAEIGDGPDVVVDDSRLRAMLQHTARTLHSGILNDCFYNEATAACRKHADGTTEGPLLPACQPGVCANSVITAGHAPPWRQAIAETEVYLRRKDLSAYQRQALKDKAAEMEAITRPFAQP
jgi:hypothetical protein